MAHWISSKLKAAETLLQQIDQQAAESLGKNEKLQSDDQLGAVKSTSVPETKPLIKNQLKKKAPENLPIQIIVPSDKPNISDIDRSKSSGNRGNDSLGPLNLNSNLNPEGVFKDGDWTELLSVPDRKGLSGGGSLNGSNNRASGILALKKDATKVGNHGPVLSPQIDEKSGSVRNNGSLKNSKNSQVGLENYSGTDSDVKASNVWDVAPKMSSIQLIGSAGELDNRDNSLPLVIDNAKMENKGNTDEVKDVSGEKQPSLNDSYHPSHKIPNSHQREFDMKLSMNDTEMFKRGMRSDRSIEDRMSSSTEKVSSLPSDGGSSSETDTGSSSDSESEREREERRKRRQQILVEKAAAKAVEAIKERENFVARLEGEKQSLEKILEERAKQQVQEASDLQTTMMETMEAAELEKQRHNNTRMEVFARLAKLETANADLARSLANVQKNLEVEVDRVAELRQQIYMKETAQEELRRKLSSTHKSGEKFQSSIGAELELEMLETEYSFIKEKVERMQDKAKALESSIETTRREIENPTEVELELKQRLGQLTDHLIQKQAKVETLTSEKAMLLLRIETVSRMLDENKGMVDPADTTGTSSRNDLESGIWQLSYSNLPSLNEKMQSGKRHLGSLVLQFDSLFCAGALFLRRNSTARIWALVYLICLHLWVFYILTSHAPASDDGRTGAVISLENINNTGGV